MCNASKSKQFLIHVPAMCNITTLNTISQQSKDLHYNIAFLSSAINTLCMSRWWIPNGPDSGLLKAHWGLWMKACPQSPVLHLSPLCLSVGFECTENNTHSSARRYMMQMVLISTVWTCFLPRGPVSAAPFQMFCYKMQRCSLGEERDRTDQLEWKEAETHRVCYASLRISINQSGWFIADQTVAYGLVF